MTVRGVPESTGVPAPRVPGFPALLGAALAGDREAVLTLALLFEQTRRPAADPDESVQSLLAPEYAACRLTEDEWHTAVDALLHQVEQAGGATGPSVVWALSKTYEPRIVPPLATLLGRLLAATDPGPRELAHQTLFAVLNVGMGCHRDLALDTVRAAARNGSGAVADTARRYLALHGHRLPGD